MSVKSTQLQERAFRTARKVEVGMVFLNTYNRSGLGTPFGGSKQSGYGREHAIQTLNAERLFRIPPRSA